jgi:hypothetical protein
MMGSRDKGVIVWTPAPGMLKRDGVRPALASASRIAWRSEPGPSSSVLVTVNVAAFAEIANAISSAALRATSLQLPFAGLKLRRRWVRAFMSSPFRASARLETWRLLSTVCASMRLTVFGKRPGRYRCRALIAG